MNLCCNGTRQVFFPPFPTLFVVVGLVVGQQLHPNLMTICARRFFNAFPSQKTHQADVKMSMQIEISRSGSGKIVMEMKEKDFNEAEKFSLAMLGIQVEMGMMNNIFYLIQIFAYTNH